MKLIKGCLHKTAKVGLIFAVLSILPGCLSDFCNHLTNRNHIAQNQTERLENSYLKISQSRAKPDEQPGKIGQM
jgi:hypothetical protein